MKIFGLGLDVLLIIGGFYLLGTFLPLIITVIHEKKKRKEGGL